MRGVWVADELLEGLSTLRRSSNVSNNVMELSNRPTELPELNLACLELFFMLLQILLKCLILLSEQECLSCKIEYMAKAT
jgi:hypothetical protein